MAIMSEKEFIDDLITELESCYANDSEPSYYCQCNYCCSSGSGSDTDSDTDSDTNTDSDSVTDCDFPKEVCDSCRFKVSSDSRRRKDLEELFTGLYDTIVDYAKAGDLQIEIYSSKSLEPMKQELYEDLELYEYANDATPIVNPVDANFSDGGDSYCDINVQPVSYVIRDVAFKLYKHIYLGGAV